MGCGSSKVVDTGACHVGYGMGTSPAYTGIRGSSKKPVLIAWDMDDIICPPDNISCVQFLNILHEEFIAKYNRVESRIVAVYDSERELNMSKGATDLRLFLQSEDVELKSSDGPTVTTVDEVVMNFAVSVPRGSTIVIIGNVAEYHEACLYARKKGLFVERVLSADGLRRLAEACHANWMCSLADFLTANSMIDWRRPAVPTFRSSSVAFRSTSIVIRPDSETGQDLATLTYEQEKAKEFVAKHTSQTGSMSGKSECAAARTPVDNVKAAATPQSAEPGLLVAEPPDENSAVVFAEDSPQCPPAADCPASSTPAVDTAVVPEVPQEEVAGLACAQDAPVEACTLDTAAAVGTSQSTLPDSTGATSMDQSKAMPSTKPQEDSPVQDVGAAVSTSGLDAGLEDDVVNLAVDTALENVTYMVSCDMASTPGEVCSAASEASDCNQGGFDNIAERAVRMSEYIGSAEETDDTARKSQRIVRPSMAVSMFRGRRHIAATIDPDATSDEDDGMEIAPMDIPDEEDSEQTPGNPYLGPDPMMTWKAQVLRALRAADDSTMTIGSLAALAPIPIEGSSYSDHLHEHLIDRKLAKWVVDNESIQLTT